MAVLGLGAVEPVGEPAPLEVTGVGSWETPSERRQGYWVRQEVWELRGDVGSPLLDGTLEEGWSQKGGGFWLVGCCVGRTTCLRRFAAGIVQW